MRSVFSLSRPIRAAVQPMARHVATARPAVAARPFSISFKTQNEQSETPEESVLGTTGASRPARTGFFGSADAHQTFSHLLPTAENPGLAEVSVDSLTDVQVLSLPAVIPPGPEWHLPPSEVALRRTVSLTLYSATPTPAALETGHYVYKTFQFETRNQAHFFFTGVFARYKRDFNRATPILSFDAEAARVTVGLPVQHGIGAEVNVEGSLQSLQQELKAARDPETDEASKEAFVAKARASFSSGFNSLHLFFGNKIQDQATYTLTATDNKELPEGERRQRGDGRGFQRDGYAPRQREGYVPRQQEAYTPRQQGSYTPRQQGAYTPRQQGAYTPRQQGSYTPRQQGAYVPREQGAYTPRQRGSYSSRQQEGYAPRGEGSSEPEY